LLIEFADGSAADSPDHSAHRTTHYRSADRAATPPVTAPLESASAAVEEAQISAAVAAASIHRDIKTSIGLAGRRSSSARPLVRLLTALSAKGSFGSAI